ncbi:MAG TPA: hypothetical protein GX691_04920, partial [Clostridia bacterium]|nr:hypothetical protein [Clostridia bacterium]
MIEMVKVRQFFEDCQPLDIEAQLRTDFERLGIGNKLSPGSTIGLAIGSRGIDRLDAVVKTAAEILKEYGAKPAVFAAMGSHGGTEAGQLAVLRSLNISEDRLGIAVKASDNYRQIGVFNGLPLYVNSLSLSFDYIVPVNRVKPHTSFRGPIESGLTKMVAVGIGGPKGARVIHSRGVALIPKLIEEAGQALTEYLPILFGVALLEDKRHRLKKIYTCEKEEFAVVDRKLLIEARRHSPGLPFEEIDVLIVDQIGKCFSGTGMDTNVIGRFGIRGIPDRGPKIKFIVALDLAEESHGNANGIGLADITTRKLVEKIDYNATLRNVLTTSFLDRAKIPVTLSSDKEAIETAINLLPETGEEVRLV